MADKVVVGGTTGVVAPQVIQTPYDPVETDPGQDSITVRDMSRHLGHGGMPLLEHLGVSFTEAVDGESAGLWTLSPSACNPGGTVQGGMFMVVFDAAMSLAVLSLLPPGEVGVSIDLNSSQPRPAVLGSTFAVSGRVVRRGNTLIFAMAEVRDDNGEIIGYGSGSFLRRRLS